MPSHEPTDEQVALASALSGRYEVERELGRGGMARVYLARDGRHDRRVAIKVLNPELGAVLGVERFLSEIRVTANLQHPNVLPLFDSGEAAGLLYYVMPFVDGESLRAKLTRERQLPVEQAVRIAIGIANAAEYAHGHGIVHRDLKPENILLQSGQPIVADFGIALAVSNAGGARATGTGISVGTPQYMSPEQALGDRVIDARSDVYAIGAMLYEMLVGERPHTGDSSQTIIARLLTEPVRPVRDSRPSVPVHVDAAVGRALEKLPADRFSTAGDFADALQGRGTLQAASPTSQRARRVSARVIVGVGVASLVAIAASLGWWRSTHLASPSIQFIVDPPHGASLTTNAGLRVAVSPDGQTIAYVTAGDSLYVRQLDHLEATLIRNAVPRGPELHFSADGKSIAYWNRGPNTIAIGPHDASASPVPVVHLNALGKIVSYSSNLLYEFNYAFWLVRASGGTPRRIAGMDTTLDVRWGRATMLPDGKTILFSVIPRGANGGQLARLSIGGGPRTLLNVSVDAVVGYADGMLFVLRGGRMVALRLDAGRRKVLGDPVDVLPGHPLLSNSVTMNGGTLAYIDEYRASRKIEMLDLFGNVSLELPDIRLYYDAVPSPDGQRIAVTIRGGTWPSISLYDLRSHQFTPLTQTFSDRPIWTHDGKRIVFLQGPPAESKPYWISVDGSGPAEPLPGTASIPPGSPITLSPDDKYALFVHVTPGGVGIVTAVPLAGGAPIPVLESAPGHVAVSPNGKWLAYDDREGQNRQVFIRSFPGGTTKMQISMDRGDDPKWSPDGRKLYYRSFTEVRAVTLDIDGDIPRIVRTGKLFSSVSLNARPFKSWTVHPDGKHFVVVRPVGPDRQLVVVVNWMKGVRARIEGR